MFPIVRSMSSTRFLHTIQGPLGPKSRISDQYSLNPTRLGTLRQDTRPPLACCIYSLLWRKKISKALNLLQVATFSSSPCLPLQAGHTQTCTNSGNTSILIQIDLDRQQSDYYFHTFHKSLMGMLPSCSTSHAIFKTVLVFWFRPFLAVRVHFDPP